MTATARAPLSPARLVLLGHAALAVALFATYGGESLLGVLLVVAALAAWAKALQATFRRVPAGVDAAVGLGWVVAHGSAVGPTALVWLRPPGNNLETGVTPFVVLDGCAALLLATYGLDVLALRALPRPFVLARRAALFLLAVAVGVWILHAAPNPKIDLFPVHQQTAEAMLAGKSIYEPGVIRTTSTMPFERNEILDEYTYLPFGACLTTLAYAVTHDFRWSDLVSQLVGGLLLWLAARRSARQAWRVERVPSPRREAWADLVAAAFLFHPRGPFVLEQGWTESLAVPFLGGFVLFALARRPLLASVCLGLLCAMKQHLVLYVPFLALVPGVGLAGVGVAAAVALATVLPFAIRSPYGFFRGPFAMLVHNPFRTDALNIPAELARIGLILPSWVGFVAALAPIAWVARVARLPRRLAPLLLASSVAFGLFYLLGRQAFCNYYYLLDATVLFAGATLLADGEGEPDAS